MENQEPVLDLNNTSQSLPSTKNKFINFLRNPYFFIPAVIILIAVVFLFFWKSQQKPEISGAFDLKAQLADATGIKPETGFVLATEKNYSTDQIKQFLTFSPAVDFTVEKTTSSQGVSAGTGTPTQSYKIQPTESLNKGDLYQAAINNPDYAEREFSWAFQVKTPFQVSKVFPRDKGTNVPLNSGIEITLNRPNPINIKDYFSINPAVEGTFEARGEMLIFKPKSLQPKTVYTVTIKKGMTDKTTRETTEKDLSFKFETGKTENKPQDYAQDDFSFNNDWVEFLPDRKPVITIYAGEKTNFSNIDIALYKLDSAEDFVNSYASSRKWDLNWSSFQNYYSYVPPENKKILSFKPDVKVNGWQKSIEIPQELAAGYYVLYSRYKDQNEEMWLEINPQADYFSVTSGKGIFWLYDFGSRKPIAGSKLSLMVAGKDAVKLGSTGADGLMEFNSPEALLAKNDDNQGLNFFKVDSPSVLPKVVQILGQAGEGNKFWSYISTDRPVYQMSDTLHFWGVIKGRQEDLKEKKVTVNIREQSFYYDARLDGLNTGLFASQKVKVSPFDTVQGAIDFKGFSPGSYVAEVMYGEEVLTTSNFEIQTYTKPAYQIKVTQDKDQIYAGSEVKFNVKATFFDGTPVSGLDLFEDYNEKDLKLDANGETTVSYTPQYDESENYPSSLNVRFSPKLSEEGDIYGEGNVAVFGPDIYLRSFSKKDGGDKTTVTAKLNSIVLHDTKVGGDEEGYSYYNDFIGDPVKNYSLKAKIVKTTNVREENGEYYDDINKVTQKRYKYKKVEEDIDSFTGNTNDKGEWIFQKEFPKAENVSYKVIISGSGKNGRKIESTAYVYNSYEPNEDSQQTYVSLKSNAEEDGFRPGDSVNLDVVVDGGILPEKSPVLFYRYRNSIDKIVTGTDLSLEEKFDDSFIPAASYRAVVLGSQGFLETNSVYAALNQKEKDLKINIETDKAAYRPKDKIKVSFNVKDKDGQPAMSEINASAVDEAIFKVVDSMDQGILSTLYAFAGAEPITGATNFTPTMSGEMGGCFLAGTEITLPNGKSTPIETIKTGDKILTFASTDDKKIVPAIVQGLSQHAVDEYLIINDKLKVTPEHRLLVNSQWTEAGTINVGDSLTLNNGRNEVVKKIEKRKGHNIPVYNIVVGGYHTYFANGYYVHNEEKGGEPRSNFTDTALFQSVDTKNNGEAEMEFTAPDNVTSWRLTAKAFSPEKIMAGEMVKSIKTTLPFFVDATLSNIYLEGDEPTIKLRVFGTNYKPGEKVSFSVKSKSLDLDLAQDSNSNTIYLPLEKLKEGNHSFVITAKQGANTDAIIRKITVAKSYTRSTIAKAYDLDSHLENISGNPNGMTTLVFSDRGKGKYLPAIQDLNWNSGIRADQMVARYLGQKMLKDNFGYENDITAPDLSEYYTENGAIGLFPAYGAEDVELSAKIADAANDFADKGKLSDYFQKILADQNSDMHHAIKSLYGLASLKIPILDKIHLAETNTDKMDLEDKTYLALAMARIGDKEAARNFYLQNIKNKLTFKGDEGWSTVDDDKTKTVKFTATMAYLQALIDVRPDFDSFWNYLDRNQPQQDLDLLEKALAVNVGIKKIKTNGGELTLESPLRNDKIIVENGIAESITVSSEELSKLKISGVKGSIGLTSYYEAPTSQNKIKKDDNISIVRNFENATDGSKNFKEGDIVRVTLSPKISNVGPDGNYQIIDFLPSGLRPAMQLYNPNIQRNDNDQCRPVWYPNRIENNIIYFNVDKNFEHFKNCQNRSLVYYARIVSLGNYKADGAILQSINNPAITNYSAEDKILIK